jgi:hypothetical protein
MIPWAGLFESAFILKRTGYSALAVGTHSGWYYLDHWVCLRPRKRIRYKQW